MSLRHRINSVFLPRFFSAFNKNNPNYVYLIQWILISIVIGSCIGSASAIFLHSLAWVTNYRSLHSEWIFLLPFAGLAIGYLYHYLGKGTEAGNNLIIDTINHPKDIVPLKMAPLVFVGTLITHLFGGSAGREGTALQMAGSIADQFSKPFRLTKEERKPLIIAAVAGGFGSVFGTPLAGTFFAMEFYRIGKINYSSLFPALMTAIISHIVAEFWNAPHTHYTILHIPDVSLLTIFYAIVAGIAFGLCARCFSFLLKKVTQFFKHKIAYAPLRPFVGGCIVLFFIWSLDTTRYIGLGIPVISESFVAQVPYYDFVFKMLLTLLTLSSGFKGGEVTPLFFIGATLGNALSGILPLPYDLLAGMGFVAVFAGATNTPIACAIMAIELFGADAAVYLFVACAVSYYCSGNLSIYTQQIVGEPKHSFMAFMKGKTLHQIDENTK